jgi:hypothetical protein
MMGLPIAASPAVTLSIKVVSLIPVVLENKWMMVRILRRQVLNM